MTSKRFPAVSSMTHVVVPLDRRDPSARAVPIAARIAERLGVGLTLVCVCEPTDDASSYLRHIADDVPADVPVTIEAVPGGEPAEVIVDVAGTTGLIVMATSATLRPHQGHIGSVAEEVVRLVGRPVILLGPKANTDPDASSSRIVAPIDGSELSERSLAVAGDLARAFGVDLWVVSVIPQRAEHEADRQLEHVFATESGYVKNRAAELHEEFGIRVGYENLHMDDPAEALVDFAKPDGAVVMATHGRSGLSRLFAGSVTTGVVARSKRPVVVWRPADDPAEE